MISLITGCLFYMAGASIVGKPDEYLKRAGLALMAVGMFIVSLALFVTQLTGKAL